MQMPAMLAQLGQEIQQKQEQLQKLRELQPAWVKYEALHNQVSHILADHSLFTAAELLARQTEVCHDGSSFCCLILYCQLIGWHLQQSLVIEGCFNALVPAAWNTGPLNLLHGQIMLVS